MQNEFQSNNPAARSASPFVPGLHWGVALVALLAVSHYGSSGVQAADSVVQPRPLPELQRDMVNLRFGMFIHFSPTTYLDVPDQLMPDHAPPRQGKDGVLGTADDLQPSLLNPIRLDCGQWADAARSAGMRFAVLTTKHHDGFCLWPSKYSNYTVAQGCNRDVVREFVDAFRERGIKVGLYYSIRDRTERIAGDEKQGGVSPAKIALIKNQLTELLTNYGEILYVVFDAWGNCWHESPTFADIPYAVIRDHIKSLQPNCIVAQHNESRYVSDVLHIEQRAGIALPAGVGWPAVAGDTLQDQWFWRTNCPDSPLKSVKWIVEKNLLPLNERNIAFQLNCAPNRDGLMDSNVVARLAEIGRIWQAPPPLVRPLSSWQDWPVPSAVKLFKGKNIARAMPARHSAGKENCPAERAVDGNLKSFNEVTGQEAWLEVDLGESRMIAGIQIWNRADGLEGRLAKGRIFISEQPFTSNDPNQVATQPEVKMVSINEPPGYPTPYTVASRGRYVRVQSDTGQPLHLGELEVYAATP